MIVDCKHCGKPFRYWEAGAGGWGSREAEDIDCPHCGKTHGRQVTAGHFDSAKLTEDEEREYVAEKAKGRS
jgi:hypothetical protein